MRRHFTPRGLPRQAQRYADRPRLDFKAIASQALADAPHLLRMLLPDGKIEGREYVALNPLRADQSPGSFRINLGTGQWADFATGDRGGDLISLTAYLFRMRQGEGARRLLEMMEGLPRMGGTYYGR
jgi:hypothetical protein